VCLSRLVTHGRGEVSGCALLAGARSAAELNRLFPTSPAAGLNGLVVAWSPDRAT